MKKYISVALIVAMLLAMSSIALAVDDSQMALEPIEEYVGNIVDADITEFVNYSASDNELLSEARNTFTDTVELMPLEGSLTISGGGNQLSYFEFVIPIEDGAFVEPQEAEGTYDLLSVLQFTEVIRIILKDNAANNMYYIEVPNCYSEEIQPYNQNWYLEFVSSEIETENPIVPFAESTRHEKTYTQTTTIYGDKYKEIIVLQFQYEWPDEMNNSTGDSFNTTLGIKSKTTEITLYGQTRPTIYDGNSMYVNNVVLKAATPKGEYFRRVDTYYDGDESKSFGGFSIDFALSIPGTPLGISYNPPTNGNTKTSSDKSDSFPCPDKVNGEKTVTLECDFRDVNRWLDEAATNDGMLQHYIDVDLSVETYTPDQVLGRKGLSFLWNFMVGSTGNCNGVAVDPTFQNSSFSNTVYYNLVD